MSAAVSIVDAKPEHAWYVAENMRADDIAELEASGVTPLRACTRGVQTSTWAKTALVDDRPAVLWGVSPTNVLGGVAAPWLLGTDDVFRIKVRFLKECRPYIAEMLRSHSVLRNYVDARNAVSIKWLRWLGFELLPARPIGVNGELFHPFELRADDVYELHRSV